jgi:hypoxanthine phosphoribosyltransferase
MGVAAEADWLCDLDRVLLPETDIQRRVRELALEIQADHAGQRPLVLGVLTGAFVFVADLVRALALPLEVAFVSTSSYGDSACSTGRVQVADHHLPPLSGRHVVLVEDIVDTGHTLTRLVDLLTRSQPASLAVCCLLDKPERREVAVTVDYRGFSIPNEFVVGYGLDYCGRFRHLPYVATLKPVAYQGKAE